MTADSSTKPSAPFFIVGCGRSGTTLLRTMLNRHSRVAVPLESLFIIDYLKAKDGLDRDVLIKTLLQEYELHEWGIDIDPSDLVDTASARDAIERLHELYLLKHGKQIWGQKTPRFVHHGEVLKRAWPDAKFVHVVRNPHAVVSSLIRSDVHRSNAYFGAQRWARDVAAGLRLAETFPGDVLLVRYEDLVSDPERELRRVCTHLGLGYEPEIATPQKRETGEYGSYYANVHALLDKPPSTDRIDVWRTALSPRQLRLVDDICGPLIPGLGYQPASASPSAKSMRGYVSALKAERVLGFSMQVVKSLRERNGYLVSYARRKVLVRGLATSIREGIAIRRRSTAS